MKPSLFSTAVRHSVDCFMNSLLKEWNHFEIDSQHRAFTLTLKDGSKLIMPLNRFSELGHHEFSGSLFAQNTQGKKEIDFDEWTELMIAHLSSEFDTNEQQALQFKSRVFDSVETIDLTLQNRLNELTGLFKNQLNFQTAEQGLFVGHSFHPTPKSRDEFSVEDMKQFSPELGASFKLDWFMVHPDLIYHQHSESFQDLNWVQSVIEHEFVHSTLYDSFLKQGYVPFMAHPWQAEQLLKNADIQTYQLEEKLIHLGPSDQTWYPTSSLRSLYREGSEYMLKFSMSVRLTNSIRHMLPHEAVRGLQLHDVLSTETGKKFLHEHPSFHVLQEPAFIALKTRDQKPMIESMVVCRENPFIGAQAESRAVLATLTQNHPTERTNLITQMLNSNGGSAKEWFKRYLQVAVRPLMLAQANYGIILGAHQQNLILGFEQGYPTEAFFRDCHGTGYSELGFANFADQVSLIQRENGNVVSEKMGNHLFTYYLILNSTFNVISALSQAGEVGEMQFIQDLRHFLTQLKDEGVRDSSCIDYLLNQETLMHKGNFLCSFRNLNENTTEDPMAIFTPISNPIRSFV